MLCSPFLPLVFWIFSAGLKGKIRKNGVWVKSYRKFENSHKKCYFMLTKNITLCFLKGSSPHFASTANLGEWINFNSAWNHQKTIFFWWFQEDRSLLIRLTSLKSRDKIWRRSFKTRVKHLWRTLPRVFSWNFVQFLWTSTVKKNKDEWVSHMHFASNKAKRWISKRVFEENKTHQIFGKTKISYPVIRARTFWDSPFCPTIVNLRPCYLIKYFWQVRDTRLD